MQFDATGLFQYGAIGIIAALFIYLHILSLKSSAERERRMGTDLETNRKECKIENDKLAARVQTVEDRGHNAQTTLLQTCQETLRINCQTFSQWTDHVSGKHEAVDPRITDPTKKSKSDRHNRQGDDR